MNRRSFSLGAGAAVAGLALPALAQTALAIDEGMFIDINGVQQWITIRGRDLRNPVMLWLQGGPGIGASFLAPVFADWERDFTMVLWDQPGGGATDLKNAEAGPGPLTIPRFTRDGIAVAEFVRKHLKVRKLVLFGISWGTLLGIEMVKQRPDLFSAYVGTAQVVSGARGSRLGYDLALQGARERQDKTAIAALERIGPPPYAKFEDFLVRQTYTNPPGQPASPAEKAATAAIGKLLSAPTPPDAHYVAYRTIPASYNGGKAFLDTQRAMFGESWRWEARDLGLTFKVPVFIFQGENDLNTPTPLAREYFDEIRAPKKAFALIPGASHNTVPFHAELLKLLQVHVLPAVGRRR